MTEYIEVGFPKVVTRSEIEVLCINRFLTIVIKIKLNLVSLIKSAINFDLNLSVRSKDKVGWLPAM